MALVIAVAMRDEIARHVLAEAIRMNRIRETSDCDAFVPRRLWIRVAAHLRSFERGNQLAVRDIELARARVGRTRNPVENFWIGWIRNVQDAPAAIGLRAGIHVPAAVDLLDVDLEWE